MIKSLIIFLSSEVTLHVSVWVEIGITISNTYLTKSRSTWACELKSQGHCETCHSVESRSTWACELKYKYEYDKLVDTRHAPRERVSWNASSCLCKSNPICHAPRERVSWNLSGLLLLCKEQVTLHVSVWVEIFFLIFAFIFVPVTLHVSVWVEIQLSFSTASGISSRSTWACELKYGASGRFRSSFSHAPRERVSWNTILIIKSKNRIVTLHVSVWVEIWIVNTCNPWISVTLHVSVWVEIVILDFCQLLIKVTLHVSVWVEIILADNFW